MSWIELLALPVVFLVIVVSYLIIYDLRYKKWARAFDLHNQMHDKYCELMNDPLTTEREIKKWLSVFDEVDEIFKRDCSDMKLVSVGHKARRFIYKDELTKEELDKD